MWYLVGLSGKLFYFGFYDVGPIVLFWRDWVLITHVGDSFENGCCR